MESPDKPIKPSTVGTLTGTERRMAAKARKAVLETGDWLTASQFARMAGLRDARSHTNKWRKDGQIFTIRYRGVDYFPRYALDPSIGDQPTKGLARVLSVFHGRKDDWGTAYWFASVNSLLGGKRPQDLPIDQPDRVVAAAEDEVAGVVHG